jgi:hypothetical protein
MPASLKLTLSSVGPAEQVEVIGTMTAFFAAAQTAGAPLLGLVAGAGSFRLAFAAAAGAPVAALLLQARLVRLAMPGAISPRGVPSATQPRESR